MRDVLESAATSTKRAAWSAVSFSSARNRGCRLERSPRAAMRARTADALRNRYRKILEARMVCGILHNAQGRRRIAWQRAGHYVMVVVSAPGKGADRSAEIRTHCDESIAVSRRDDFRGRVSQIAAGRFGDHCAERRREVHLKKINRGAPAIRCR